MKKEELKKTKAAIEELIKEAEEKEQSKKQKRKVTSDELVPILLTAAKEIMEKREYFIEGNKIRFRQFIRLGTLIQAVDIEITL